jgi:hypothetical protein
MQLTLIPHEQEVLSWAVESLISDLGTELVILTTGLCGKICRNGRESY